jgi:hypothetical protein
MDLDPGKSKRIHADPDPQHCLLIKLHRNPSKSLAAAENTFLNNTSALWILYSARIILTFNHSDNAISEKNYI